MGSHILEQNNSFFSRKGERGFGHSGSSSTEKQDFNPDCFDRAVSQFLQWFYISPLSVFCYLCKKIQAGPTKARYQTKSCWQRSCKKLKAAYLPHTTKFQSLREHKEIILQLLCSFFTPSFSLGCFLWSSRRVEKVNEKFRYVWMRIEELLISSALGTYI